MTLWYVAMPFTLLFCGWLLYMEERGYEESRRHSLGVVGWCLVCIVGLMVLSAPLWALFG